MNAQNMRERAMHFTHRYGHYGNIIVATLAVTAAVTGLFVDQRHPTELTRIQSAAVVAFGCIAVVLVRFMHGTRLCEICAEKMPLNGDAAAAKYRRALRLTHLFADTRRSSYKLIGVIWAYILLSVIINSTTFDRATQIPLTLAVAVLLLSIHVHYMLQPWCPWCHWDDGGDEEPSPVPTDPHTVKI